MVFMKSKRIRLRMRWSWHISKYSYYLGVEVANFVYGRATGWTAEKLGFDSLQK
jgi:hypothetical protein